MGEQPNLPQQTLINALGAHYKVKATALTFLPIGADMDSAVYRVEAGGRKYFLKLRALAGFSARSLLIPSFLHESGIPHILAALPTRSGAVWVDLDQHALSLYPFLEGNTATEAGLAEADWSAFGATVHRIHHLAMPPELEKLLPTEAYIPSRRHVLTDVLPLMQDPRDPIELELAAAWHVHGDQIDLLLGRADALAQRLRRESRPLVLCHADLHTWNVLVDEHGEFWIVDWDEALRAPKERDLMFVIGGIGAGLVRPQETARFLDGYRGDSVDPLALAYYRYAWAVQDLAAYAEQVLLRPGLSDAARREGLDGFKRILQPGQIASIAFATEFEDESPTRM